MNQHPVLLLDPVLHWLDWVLATYGLEIYMVTVWLSPLFIVWILSGGFWRRLRRRIVKAPPIMKETRATPPPLPPTVGEGPQRGWLPFENDSEQSFAA